MLKIVLRVVLIYNNNSSNKTKKNKILDVYFVHDTGWFLFFRFVPNRRPPPLPVYGYTLAYLGGRPKMCSDYLTTTRNALAEFSQSKARSVLNIFSLCFRYGYDRWYLLRPTFALPQSTWWDLIKICTKLYRIGTGKNVIYTWLYSMFFCKVEYYFSYLSQKFRMTGESVITTFRKKKAVLWTTSIKK